MTNAQDLKIFPLELIKHEGEPCGYGTKDNTYEIKGQEYFNDCADDCDFSLIFDSQIIAEYFFKAVNNHDSLVEVISDLISEYKADDETLSKGYVCGLTQKQQDAIIRARELLKQIQDGE